MAKHGPDVVCIATDIMMSAYTLRALHSAVVNQSSGAPIDLDDFLMLVRGLIERAGIYLENAHTCTGEGKLGAFGLDGVAFGSPEAQQ